MQMEEIESEDEKEQYKITARSIRAEKGCVTRAYLHESLGVPKSEIGGFFARHPEMIEVLDIVPDHWGRYLTAAHHIMSREDVTYKALAEELHSNESAIISAMARNKELRKRFLLVKRSRWSDHNTEDSPEDTAWLEYYDAIDKIRARNEDPTIDEIAKELKRDRRDVTSYFDEVVGAREELGVKE